jgi:NAD(P)-dependent dehydrogenase (short-subunit alcohol dehydrogenase family)
MTGLVVLGSGDIAATILRRFLADGWRAAGVARGPANLAGTRAAGALALDADAREPESLRRALGQAAAALGGIVLIVNAADAARPQAGEPFGGGAVADASLEGYRRWGPAVSEAAFVFLSEGARLLREAGDGGTLVQIAGEAGRRVVPGQGPRASGQAAVRALVQAAAQELRGEGIRACLLQVDAPVESSGTPARPADAAAPSDATVRPEDVAAAVGFLARQDMRGITYELQLTAAGRDWSP